METARWTILLVDDTPEDRELYRSYLRNDPTVEYTFVETGLGHEVLTLCSTHHPDCLLLDQRLPDLEGLECLAHLQATYDTHMPPVILLTGTGNEALAVEAMKRGAQDYLVKGQLTAAALQRAVQNAINYAVLQRALATQRQQTQERDTRLRLALEAADMGAWDWDITTNTLIWSEQLAPGFGLPAGTAPATVEDFLALVHPEDRQRVEQAITGVLTEGQAYTIEYRLLRSDGRICWRSSRGTLFRDASGQPVRLAGINMDITARKQMEDTLRHINATLEQRVQERTALLEVMQDITRAANEAASSREALQYAVDRLCTYMHWPVGHAYLAVTAEERRWVSTDIWHVDTPLRREVFQEVTQEAAFAAGAGLIGQVGALGKPLWNVEVHSDAVLEPQYAALVPGLKAAFGVPVLVGTEVAAVLEFYAYEPLPPVVDVLDALLQIGTQLGRAIERERATEQEHRQQEALFQREKLAAMGSLLASVAHELNNPLAVILMQADLLRTDAGDGPLAEYARDISQAAVRCERLVRQFLTLARQHSPSRQAVDLNTLVTDTLDLLAQPLRVDTIAVDVRLARSLPPLQADPHQLQQVLVNLLTNAQHALRDIATERRLTLTTRQHEAPARVILEVTDNGPGIPLALQARIFEPFFTTKPVGVGTGLGLSLCQGIIESHGGTIRCTSQPGQGTTFSMEFPVVTALPSPPDAPAPGTPVPLVAPLSILIVDDEPSIVRGLARLLSRDGHQVDTAANGQIALTKLQERLYDLILSDLRMPELDGPGLYRTLARQHPHLCQRLIFLTGDTLSQEIAHTLAQLDVPQLTKPFTVPELRHAIQQVLQQTLSL